VKQAAGFISTSNFKLQTSNFSLGLRINFRKMKFSVQVKVMPLKELLDPQGKAVMTGLANLGLKKIEDVRMGKNISLQIEAASEQEARQLAEEASKKLLANPVMEYFEISVNTPNS
jgi:phosphoribosylformylglycinamidine synthase subunit PurS